MSESMRVGSTQLLQDLLSRRLIGGLCSVIDADNCGWVVVTYFSTPDAFEFVSHGAREVLTIERRIALSFAAMLQVHAREASLLHQGLQRPCPAPEPAALEVSGGVRDAPLVCSWSQALGVRRADAEDQVELRLPDQVAAQVAAALIERLAQAQIAAHAELLEGAKPAAPRL